MSKIYLDHDDKRLLIGTIITTLQHDEYVTYSGTIKFYKKYYSLYSKLIELIDMPKDLGKIVCEYYDSIIEIKYEIIKNIRIFTNNAYLQLFIVITCDDVNFYTFKYNIFCYIAFKITNTYTNTIIGNFHEYEVMLPYNWNETSQEITKHSSCNIINIFNSFMRKYYNKDNYIRTCTSDKIVINKILISPKKLKNIIIILKILIDTIYKGILTYNTNYPQRVFYNDIQINEKFFY